MKKKSKTRVLIITATFFIFLVKILNAVIDSKNKITIIDAHYTFTNFEYAQGFIRFKNGFSLTPSTTILLDIYDLVDGPINLNQGTIIINGNLFLGTNCSFYGSGYIQTNGYSLNAFNSGMTITSTLYFIGDLSFNGNKITRLTIDKERGVLNCQKSATVVFSNVDLIVNNASQNFIFPAAKLTSFSIQNTNLFMTDISTFEVQANTFYLDGYSSIETVGLFKTDFLSVISQATSQIMPFSKIAVTDLSIGGHESVFLIGNQSHFYFNKTTTTNIGGNGVIKIDGTVYFYGTSPSRLVDMNANQGLLLGPGAKLILNSIYFRPRFV